ncbi:MAG TPA: hypothetical protein VGB14_00040 [Acidimicrobiales bacterium]
MRSARGRWSAAMAAVVLALVVGLGAAAPASAQTTEPTVVTVPTSVRQPAATEDGTDDETAETIWRIIAGLLVVAFLLTVLTVRYWWVTRPSRQADEDGDEAAAEEAPSRA